MRIAGSLFIVLSFFLIGYTKRKKSVCRQEVYEQLIRLTYRIKNEIEFSTLSVSEMLEAVSAGGEFDELVFLDEALAKADKSNDFTACVCNSFSAFCELRRLERGCACAMYELLNSVCVLNSQVIVEKCCSCAQLLEESVRVVKDENRQKRGYYETVYTLIGAAVSIALI